MEKQEIQPFFHRFKEEKVFHREKYIAENIENHECTNIPLAQEGIGIISSILPNHGSNFADVMTSNVEDIQSI